MYVVTTGDAGIIRAADLQGARSGYPEQHILMSSCRPIHQSVGDLND